MRWVALYRIQHIIDEVNETRDFGNKINPTAISRSTRLNKLFTEWNIKKKAMYVLLWPHNTNTKITNSSVRHNRVIGTYSQIRPKKDKNWIHLNLNYTWIICFVGMKNWFISFSNLSGVAKCPKLIFSWYLETHKIEICK